MAHYDKHTIMACGHLCKHYERGKDDSSNYVKFGNMDIDPKRTPLNYNLAPERQQGHFGYIKHRLSEVKVLKRADVNAMCSWVVTVPKDLQENEYQKFFTETYKFLEKRYGEKNVVSSYVHMDETTPHMHFAFVPVVLDKKKNIEKVSAKERVDKFELKTFHSDLSAHMEKIFGRDIGILNEATVEGNKSIEELKRGTAVETIQEAEKARTELKNTQEAILPLKKEKQALQSEIQGLEGHILKAREVQQVKFKKTLTGAIRGISYQDISNLKKTAERVESVDKVNEKIKQERDQALKQVESIRNHEKLLEERVIKAENEKPSLLMMMENAKLSSENDTLKKKVSYLQAGIKKLFELVPENIKKIISEIFYPQRQNEKHNHQDWEQ